MAAALVVDTSASMAFPALPAVSKFRYAVMMTAALAHLISNQGDAVGLYAAGERAPLFLQARAGRPHLRRVLAALGSLAPPVAGSRPTPSGGSRNGWAAAVF